MTSSPPRKDARDDKTSKRSSKRPPLRQHGAALLLLVMMLMLGAASVLMGAFGGGQLDSKNTERTSVRLSQAREALIGYALLHGRLPRPAASALDGNERLDGCQTENDCSGFLPWVTLGVDGVDGWGKLLRYSVTPEFTRAPVSTVSAAANKVVLARDSRLGLVYRVGHASCDNLSPCAPAVIFSNGKNNFGTSWQGALQAASRARHTDEALNNEAGNIYISRPATANDAVPGGEFDDLVTWIPLQTLFQKMAVAGAL